MAANNDENIAMLISMGFDRDQSVQALTSGGSLERAIDCLLGGGVISGGSGSAGGDNNSSTSHHGASNVGAGKSSGDVQAIHSQLSQYSDTNGRSACTFIALATACNLLLNTKSTNDPGSSIDAAFLSNSIQEGISMYSELCGASVNGPMHSSVEELLALCNGPLVTNSNAKRITSSMKLFEPSPRQGILSNSSDHPMGLEAILSGCQSDADDTNSYIAVIITKPPETILVIIPPMMNTTHIISSPTYILLDSHPRPQQLAPHYPTGSYALFHSNLSSLVASVKEIFPVTDLGNDVPEMMAMMYNSFDVYPFQS